MITLFWKEFCYLLINGTSNEWTKTQRGMDLTSLKHEIVCLEFYIHYSQLPWDYYNKPVIQNKKLRTVETKFKHKLLPPKSIFSFTSLLPRLQYYLCNHENSHTTPPQKKEYIQTHIFFHFCSILFYFNIFVRV